ncbi:DUF5818 domain-containing protein [Sphingobium bisphenolivorans]|uniref:DUF5818 domain-containing protein n=1 Tax=Sphingobium bisphenolivorans TaxID=1335760 RepID=UPI0009DBA0CE|nr:DUF5818 domain-containing protein [Sphingobium bisphenolivorans]
MPLGTRHDETGWLNNRAGQWILRRDDGGEWHLDVGFLLSWRSRNLLGRRVVITGKRSGFNLLDVEKICVA